MNFDQNVFEHRQNEDQFHKVITIQLAKKKEITESDKIFERV